MKNQLIVPAAQPCGTTEGLRRQRGRAGAAPAVAPGSSWDTEYVSERREAAKEQRRDAWPSGSPLGAERCAAPRRGTEHGRAGRGSRAAPPPQLPAAPARPSRPQLTATSPRHRARPHGRAEIGRRGEAR